MAQNPWLVDQLKIEPGATGTRLISRNSTTNALQFQDPVVSAATSLLNLVGIRNISNVYVVGTGGDGSAYTAIQDALDDIPDTSSATDPSAVLVFTGAYTENLTIEKDGVYIIGLGGVTITNDSADATITIEDTPTTSPETVGLYNLTIANTDDGEACIAVTGNGTYAYGTATVAAAPLAAGDTLTINGTALTGVSGSRTSGSDDFSVDGGTEETIAAEIAEALNDTNNSFAVLITATRSNAIVTMTANTPGAGGNAITLASSTTPAGNITLSGALFTNGSSSGSIVANGEVLISDCTLIASGNGGYQVIGNTVNNIRVQGGTWRGSSSTSIAEAINCAAFRVFGVEWTNDIELEYDTGNDQPATLTSIYELKQCGRVHDVLCGLTGTGGLLVTHCPEVGDVVQGGDQTLGVSYSRLNSITLEDTTAAMLVSSNRGTATTASGTPTLSEGSLTGTVVFAGTATAGVTFDILQPDTSYAVFLDCLTLGSVPQVTAKTTSGFTVSFSGPYTGTVYYTVNRQQ